VLHRPRGRGGPVKSNKRIFTRPSWMALLDPQETFSNPCFMEATRLSRLEVMLIMWGSPHRISSPAQRVRSRFKNCCAEGVSAASRNRMIDMVLRTFQ
jgi:hypothetical protein